MKFKILMIALLVTLTMVACSKKELNEDVKTSSAGNSVPAKTMSSSMWYARMSGADYSQSIAIDTANRMIRSYLTSVNYTGNDTALRALSFDADTLRSYLSDGRITTIKFFVAHRLEYINNGGYGVYSGMNPNALTLIIVGLNEDNDYIRSSTNGFYEHCSPCPTNCTGTDALLH